MGVVPYTLYRIQMIKLKVSNSSYIYFQHFQKVHCIMDLIYIMGLVFICAIKINSNQHILSLYGYYDHYFGKDARSKVF